MNFCRIPDTDIQCITSNQIRISTGSDLFYTATRQQESKSKTLTLIFFCLAKTKRCSVGWRIWPISRQLCISRQRNNCTCRRVCCVCETNDFQQLFSNRLNCRSCPWRQLFKAKQSAHCSIISRRQCAAVTSQMQLIMTLLLTDWITEEIKNIQSGVRH